ncbi:TPA: hypothetical protein PQB18_002870, partial [Staphylococcus aureus]|nr:hypothetical protein [Staphylococcus aureus]
PVNYLKMSILCMDYKHMQTITGQWGKKGYLIKGEKDRLQKKVSHKNIKYRGFAINKEMLEELGFDFSNSHNPYSDY